MTAEIEAIFFDMGTTLRTRVGDEKLRRHGLEQLVALLEAKEPAEELYRRLAERYAAYRQWAQETLVEAPEKEIWTRWMLPEWPSEQIEPLAEQLTHLWRCTEGRRIVRPDARVVIAELARRGYRLGVISNTISAHAVPQGLKEYGLADYFEAVILSSTFGRRKPAAEIFWEATRRLGVSPARSAYVGDQISRDVVGPRQAGFAMAIIIDNPRAREQAQACPQFKPDVVIQDLSELLDIFAPLSRGMFR